MAFTLESKHKLALMEGFGTARGIPETGTRVQYSLGGAKAVAVPLGKVLNFDPDTPLTESPEVRKKRELLKERIIDVHGYKDFKPENLMYTSGTYEGNFLVLSQAVAPGDEIVVIKPCWHQFAAYKISTKQYEFCCGGLNPNSRVHLLTRKGEDWRYDVEGLKEVVSSRTALIAVNSPDNPTGNICTPEEMRAIYEIAEDYGAYVLHDEIYRGTEWDAPFSSSQAVNYYEKAVATNSFSKLFGWDRLRLGWLVTRDKKLLERCIAVNGWLLPGKGSISPLQLEVGLAALEHKKSMELIEHGRSYGKGCWDEMDRWMSKHKDVFNWKRPMGGFLSFPSYKLDIGSIEFCQKLAAYGVSMVPGMAYGFEKHLRLGVGSVTPEVVKAAMEQVGKFISTLMKIST